MSTKFKQTEIGNIPFEWEVKKIKDVTEKVIDNRGKTPPIVSSGYELLEVNAVLEDKKTPDYSLVRKFVDEETRKTWFRGHIKKMDILLPTVGTIGNVAILDETRGEIAQNLIGLRISKDANPNYIYYYLKNPYHKERILNLDIGGVQPSIKVPHFLNLEIALPPLIEQEQIISILSSFDDKIEVNRKINQVLENMAKALFDYWFVDYEFPNEEGNPYKSGRGKMIESEIGEVPHDWMVHELTQVVEFNPSEKIKKGDEYTYLEMKELPESGMWCYSNHKKEYNGGAKFRNDDTLMARITPCLENGKTGYVNFLQNFEIAFGSTEYIIFRAKKEIFREYIYFLVRSNSFRDKAIKSMVGSSGRQRVQTDTLMNYKISNPPIEIITNFHNTLFPLFQQIRDNSLEIQILKKIRDSLLPNLMNGSIRTI